MKRLTNKELAKFVDDQLESGVEASQIANQLAAFLISERRVRDLDSVLRSLTKLRENRGLVEISASSARSLPESIKAAIARLFEAKETIYLENIDKNLIGGAMFQTINRRLDLTLVHKLNQLKAQES